MIILVFSVVDNPNNCRHLLLVILRSIPSVTLNDLHLQPNEPAGSVDVFVTFQREPLSLQTLNSPPLLFILWSDVT